MNYKLLIGISLLSFLAVSTYMIMVKEKTPMEAGQTRATFAEWQQCKKDKNYNPFCNGTKDSKEFENCQNIKSEISFCENSNRDCNMFFIYFEEPTEDAPLPECFYKCTSACQHYASGDSYASKNYNIEHFECAYTN